MRDTFINKIYDIACSDSNVIFLSDDFSAPSLDRFRKNLSKQYINVGIAEQSLINIAAGLAIENKNVFIYMMAPFISRCYEQIKLNLCAMNLPVTIIGVGAGLSYSIAGLTHHALEDLAILNMLPNISIFNPSSNILVKELANFSYQNVSGPLYIRLDRETVNINKPFNTHSGFNVLREGNTLTILTTGFIANVALKLSDKLSESYNISTKVVDIYKFKPLNKNLIFNTTNTPYVVTIEENFNTLGKEIDGMFKDDNRKLNHFFISDFCFRDNSRDGLLEYYGLDVNSILKRITKWIR